MQTGNHAELFVLATMKGNEQEERKLHHAFKDLRISGEWYNSSKTLREFIRNNCTEFYDHTKMVEPKKQFRRAYLYLETPLVSPRGFTFGDDDA